MATTYKVQAQFPPVAKNTTFAYVSNIAIASNVLTVTTAATHGITQIGTQVRIQGVSTAGIDGYYVIQSIPLTTTFTVMSSTTTLGSTAVTPNAVATFTAVSAGTTITNKQVVNGVANMTTSSAHGLSVGDYVVVGINDTIYDSTQTPVKVIGIPTSTTFRYAVTTTTAASTAVSNGAWGETSHTGTYTVAASTQGVSSTLYIANTSNITQYYSVAVQKGGAALANQWIAKDVFILPNTTTAFTTGLALNAGEILYVLGSSNEVIFTLDGSELT